MDFSGRVKVLVKPDASKDEIVGFDEARQAWRVNISAPALKNKANVAVIKFFSRLSKKKVRIVSGLSSPEKMLMFS